MGYLKHHTIVVTGWQIDKVAEARHQAFLIFEDCFAKDDSVQHGGQLVSEIIHSVINNQDTFFIAPDGSKEGWETSNNGNKARNMFLEWLDSQTDNYCDFIEVVFGGDDERKKILCSNVSKQE